MPVDQIRLKIAMSDRLVLYQDDEASTMVWDIENDRSLGVLEYHSYGVLNVAMNCTESTAVSIGADSPEMEVMIWSLDTMQCTANLTSTDFTTCLLKDRLLLGSSDGPIKMWDIGGSAPMALMDLLGHRETVSSITAMDTSNTALSGSIRSGIVRMWDLRTGNCVRIMEGHTDRVYSVSMDSAGQTAVSGSRDMTAKIWDLGTGRYLGTHQFDDVVHDVVMHESGGSFLVAYGHGYFSAHSSARGYDDPILNADLSSLCDPESESYPHLAASRNLSRVGMCNMSVQELGLEVSVWI